MTEFKVWTDDWNEEDPHTVFAVDAEMAAEAFVEENHSDLEYADEVDVVVVTPSGEKTLWKVTVEMNPVFTATKQKGAK